MLRVGRFLNGVFQRIDGLSTECAANRSEAPLAQTTMRTATAAMARSAPPRPRLSGSSGAILRSAVPDAGDRNASVEQAPPRRQALDTPEKQIAGGLGRNALPPPPAWPVERRR